MSRRPETCRRSVLKGAAAVMALPAAGARAAEAQGYSKRAVAIVERSLVIDMLGLVTLDFTPQAYAGTLSERAKADFRASGITGIHHAFGIGGPDAYERALAFLAAWQGFAARNSDLFSVIGKAADLDRAKQAGKVGVIMGIQNAEHFRDTNDVRAFHQLGLRCAQLTYNTQTRIGSGATDRVDGGVSDFGAEIIAAMNAVGMLIDVSHCGDRTTLDAIEISPRPIAITHSNCRAINNHARTKTDEAIRALAKRGGVMGITGVRHFVRDRDPTTVEHLVDHIDHVAKLVGIEHVGIGSDADLNGYDDMPPEQYAVLKAGYKPSYKFRGKSDIDGFDHPRKMFSLCDALIRRGYSDKNIELVLGGNFRRLLGETWG